MNKIRNLLVALLLVAGVAPAQAGIIFYTDYATFAANAGSITTIDFEGIVTDTGSQSANSHTFGDTTFSPLVANASLICGKNSCAGNPFDSATYVSNFAADLDITFANGATAGGGFFGDLDGPGFGAVFNVFDMNNNLLDIQQTFLNDFGAGLPHNFLGWVTDGGDMISRINVEVNGATWLALDDFSVSSANVPEAATLILMALGLVGLGFGQRRRKQLA